jgi:hypothetical protein
MALHQTDHAALQLQHLKEKEAGLLRKLGHLKTQTSSEDHDIEGATKRAQWHLAEIQKEISTFGQPPAPAPVTPEPATEIRVSKASSKKL